MEIRGKVYCLFERSGTFKNEFRKLGVPAEDYDISNGFGQTDHIVDLFGEIDAAYDGRASLFDDVAADDFVIAFYPCLYFCQMSQFAQSLNYTNYRNLSEVEAIDKIIKRQIKRGEYLVRLTKFVRVCVAKGIRMVFENPLTGSFLANYFLKPPTVRDMDRTRRGDVFAKPTGYWFWNCEPTAGASIQKSGRKQRINDAPRGKHSGECSLGRSVMSPDYARNFICDFILGIKQEGKR